MLNYRMSIDLQLPDHLYEQVQKRAFNAKRSLGEEVVAVLENALGEDEALRGLPQDIAEQAKQLAVLEDDQLWHVARQRVVSDKAERIQELTLKQQAEGLNEQEAEEASQLRHYADRVMMLRAEAAVQLKQRGFDVSSLRQAVS